MPSTLASVPSLTANQLSLFAAPWAMALIDYSPQERRREAAPAGWAGPLPALALPDSRRRPT